MESEFAELTDGKKITNLTLLLTAMYMVSYITRINYGASFGTILLWAGIAFTGLVICVIFGKSWHKFSRQ